MPRPKKQPVAAKVNNLPNQGEEVADIHPPKHTIDVQIRLNDSPLLPHITIVVVTFRRLNEIRKTIDALLKNVVYPRHKLHWLIADDHSDESNEPMGEYVNEIIHTPRYKMLDMAASITPENGGWAKNVNLALSQVKTDFYFFIEDDYAVMKTLDLRAGVAMLLVKPEIGMLRYRGTAGGHVVFHQLEADISAYVPDHQDGVGLPGKLTYCLLDSGSPDLYLYTHGASLRRRSFDAFYGAYPEGLKLGATEEMYAHTVKDLMKTPNAPAIAILPEWIPMYFDHIGESRQHTEFDKGQDNAT